MFIIPCISSRLTSSKIYSGLWINISNFSSDTDSYRFEDEHANGGLIHEKQNQFSFLKNGFFLVRLYLWLNSILNFMFIQIKCLYDMHKQMKENDSIVNQCYKSTAWINYKPYVDFLGVIFYLLWS